jgi:hypothetical protein
MPGFCEPTTFYGILFGHQDRKLIIEGQIGSLKWVMVWEVMRDDLETGGSQIVKKLLRISNSGNGMQRPSPEIGQRDRMTVCEVFGQSSGQGHGVLAGVSPASSANDKIRCERALGRLAQRPRRQTITIPKSSIAINQQNFDIALQTVVLQTIVRNKNIAPLLFQECLSRSHTIPADHHGNGHPRRNEDRFVSPYRWIALRADERRLGSSGLATITSAENAGAKPRIHQEPYQPNAEWGLTRSPDAQIANHDNWDIQANAGEKAGGIGPATEANRAPKCI